MTQIIHKLNVMIIILLAIIGISAIGISAKDINGFYQGDEGGAYFIRQIGNKIYWVGEKGDGSYANVFAGTINSTKITGKWWDVPKGKAKGGGEITFEISGNGDVLTKISSSAPFGTKTIKLAPPTISVGITKIPADAWAIRELRSKPEGFRGNGDLTGAWNGDNFSTYYVREMPNGEVVYFAENNFWGDPGGEVKPSVAQVFIGKKVNGSITGDWVNVPKGESTGNNVLSLKIINQQELKGSTNVLRRSLPNNLRGFADLHTHPMINLGFGGKLIHGGIDEGSLLPADSDCKHNVRAKSISQALGDDKSTHGGWGAFDNPCGDEKRKLFMDIFQMANDALVTPDHSAGYPTFSGYPKWNDISHQKMWVDWIRRSYNAGQRVMVALATHNNTLAAVASGPGDGPLDDKKSGDLQVAEIKAFVGRHNDFMEVAYSAADVRRIVAANKMAIVLGVELDNIGNFNKMSANTLNPAMISAEIKRLHAAGVRYIFPIHVLDNPFGGTAVYEDLFNVSNKFEHGKFWELKCAGDGSDIKYKFDVDAIPKELRDIFGIDFGPSKLADCKGHVNIHGLSTLGKQVAIPQMMKLGMLIDIDHMSEMSANETLGLAEGVPGYPLVSGHTGLRKDQHTENSRTPEQLKRLGKLGGMFGLGSEDIDAYKWAKQYADANGMLGGEGRISFGTDLNGLVKGAPPRAAANIYNDAFPRPQTGDKTWDYRKDGVAHYGMMADYLMDIRTEPKNGALVYSNMMKNAEAFAQMWEKAEAAAKKVK